MLYQKHILNRSSQKKIFRREAHKDISLTILEIQGIVQGAFESLLKLGKSPEIYEPGTLSKLQQAALSFYKKSSIIALIRENDLEGFKNKFQKTIASIDYHTGMSYLSHAVKEQNLDFVKYFIIEGVNINLADNTGYTALHYAVEGNDERILDELLSRLVCDPNVEDRGGYTPIYIAAELGKAKYVDKLLQAGANPDLANNRYKSTACHVAVRNFHYDVVKVLLANGRVNINLCDKEGSTPVMLAEARDKNLSFLFKGYRHSPATAVTNVASKNLPATIPTLPSNAQLLANIGSMLPSGFNRPTGVQLLNSNTNTAPSFIPPSTPNLIAPNNISISIEKIKLALLNPKENKTLLQLAIKSFSKHDFFPFTLVQIDKKREIDSINTGFYNMLRDEYKALQEVKLVFQNYVDELTDVGKQKITFAQGYSRIQKIIKRMVNDKCNFSGIAITFEIYKSGYLEHLINLHENKTALQVAIEGEDVDAIKEILKEEPNRNFTVVYKQKEMTELQYAITLGKINSVESMLELASKNSNISLGAITEDAISAVKKKSKELNEINPSFKEADEYLDIDIPRNSKLNGTRLFRQLINTLPVGAKEVLNFYTPEEYRVYRVLIAEKEPKPISSVIGSTFLVKFKAITQLEKRREELLNDFQSMETKASKFVDPNEELAQIEDQLRYLKNTPFYQKNLERRKILLLNKNNDEPKSFSIFKHASKNYDIIAYSKKLITVDEAIRQGNIKSATPQGTRKNTFFGIGGRLASITPLRNDAQHIIELKITEVLNNKTKILDQEDIYTSPHVPAFRVERVETPIIFIGEDPDIKAILRIYHYRENGKYYKAYRYDHYFKNKPVDSHYEVYTQEQEFFIGDNVKLLANRFMLFLRNLRGNFEQGSYYHYILKNAHDIDIIDSARAAFFNVLNIEGKITKDIPIEHPEVVRGWHKGIRVIKNEKSKISHLSSPVLKCLQDFLVKNNYEGFVSYITTNNIYKEQLQAILYNAVELQREDSISFLLDFGVTSHPKILNAAINNLMWEYVKNNRNIKSEKFLIACNVVFTLLYNGYSDENDRSHIKYGTSPDSYSISPPNWTNQTATDLIELKRFIIRFDEFPIHMLVLSAVSKHLHALYNFTFTFGFFELHQEIATRLSLKRQHLKSQELESKDFVVNSLMEEKTTIDLIGYIEENNVQGLTSFLSQALKVEVEKYYFVLNYAIRNDKIDIVKACYPFFKGLPSANFYPPLHMAIRFQKYDIILELIALGADIKQKNDLGESAIQVAFLYNCHQAIDLFIEADEAEASLVAAINNGRFDCIKMLSKRLNVSKFSDNQDKLKKLVDPIITAIKKGHLQSVITLKEAYQELIPSHEISCLKEIMRLCLMEAAVLNQKDIFVYFVEQICKDSKIFTSLFCGKEKYLFGEIIIHSSAEIIELFILNLPSRKKNKVLNLVNCSGFNYLHFALESTEIDLEKVKIIRKLIPDIKYVTENTTPIDVIKLISGKPGGQEIFDFIIKDGFSLTNINDKIEVLSQLILENNLPFIKKAFDCKLIDPHYISSDGENLLQLIYAYFLQPDQSSVVTNPSKYKESLLFLCETYGLDVNHKDKNNNALILNQHFKRDTLSLFQAFVIAQSKTDFTVKDGNNNTVLHLLFNHENYFDVITRYLEQGGDINAINNSNRTPLEEILDKGNYRPEVVIKMRELNARAAKCLQAPRIFGIMTCSVKKEIYILVRENMTFFQMFHNESESYKFVSGNNNFSVNFCHLDKGDHSKLPPLKKILVSDVEKHSWVKMPRSFSKLTDDSFLASNQEGGDFEVSLLTKEILQYILHNNPTAIEDVDSKQYVIDSGIYKQWVERAEKLLSNLDIIYKHISTDDLDYFQKTDPLEINRHIKLAGFPLPLKVSGVNEKYELLALNSPIEAAIATGSLALTKFFLAKDQGQLSNKKSLIMLAIHFGRDEIFKLLLQDAKSTKRTKKSTKSTNNISGEDLLKYLNSLAHRSAYYFDISKKILVTGMLLTVLEHASSMKLTITQVSKLKLTASQYLLSFFSLEAKTESDKKELENTKLQAEAILKTFDDNMKKLQESAPRKRSKRGKEEMVDESEHETREVLLLVEKDTNNKRKKGEQTTATQLINSSSIFSKRKAEAKPNDEDKAKHHKGESEDKDPDSAMNGVSKANN